MPSENIENPTVHSPGTVKTYFSQPQTILQKKISRAYSLLLFMYTYSS
jgi:hypothetical protein